MILQEQGWIDNISNWQMSVFAGSSSTVYRYAEIIDGYESTNVFGAVVDNFGITSLYHPTDDLSRWGTLINVPVSDWIVMQQTPDNTFSITGERLLIDHNTHQLYQLVDIESRMLDGGAIGAYSILYPLQATSPAQVVASPTSAEEPEPDESEEDSTESPNAAIEFESDESDEAFISEEDEQDALLDDDIAQTQLPTALPASPEVLVTQDALPPDREEHLEAP